MSPPWSGYDALTAARVYREAWPAERAPALLGDETGTAFDPACVTALREVIAAEDARLAAQAEAATAQPASRPALRRPAAAVYSGA